MSNTLRHERGGVAVALGDGLAEVDREVHRGADGGRVERDERRWEPRVAEERERGRVDGTVLGEADPAADFHRCAAGGEGDGADARLHHELTRELGRSLEQLRCGAALGVGGREVGHR